MPINDWFVQLVAAGLMTVLAIVGTIVILRKAPAARRRQTTEHRAPTTSSAIPLSVVRSVLQQDRPWSRPPDTQNDLTMLAAHCKNNGSNGAYENTDGSVVDTLVTEGTVEEQIIGMYMNLRSFWAEHQEGFSEMWRILEPEQRRNLLRESMPFIPTSPRDERSNIRGHNISGLAALIPEATLNYMLDNSKGMLTVMQERVSRPVEELDVEDWDHTIRVIFEFKWKPTWGANEAELKAYRQLVQLTGMPFERRGRQMINPSLPPHVKRRQDAEQQSRMMHFRTAMRMYVENAGPKPLLRRFPRTEDEPMEYRRDARRSARNVGAAIQALCHLRGPKNSCREVLEVVLKRQHGLLCLLAGSADEYLTEIVRKRTGTVMLPGHMGLGGVGLTEEEAMAAFRATVRDRNQTARAAGLYNAIEAAQRLIQRGQEAVDRDTSAALALYRDACRQLWPFESSPTAINLLVRCMADTAEAHLRLESPSAALETVEDARLLNMTLHDAVANVPNSRDLLNELDARGHALMESQRNAERQAAEERRRAAELARVEQQRAEQEARQRREAQARRDSERRREIAAARAHQARRAAERRQAAEAEAAVAAAAAAEREEQAREQAREQAAQQREQEERAAIERERDRAEREQVLADRRRRREAREASRRQQAEATQAAELAERTAALERAEWATQQIEQRRRQEEMDRRERAETELVADMSYRDEQRRRAAARRAVAADHVVAADDQITGIAALPPAHLSEESVDAEPAECVICFEEMQPPVTRPCKNNHPMHVGCAIDWRDTCTSGVNNTPGGAPIIPHCPVCRTPM